MSWLRSASRRLTARGLEIADLATGTILVTTHETRLGDKTSQYPAFVEPLQVRDEYVGDLKLTSQDVNPILHISRVIKGKRGEVTGVLIMHIDADADEFISYAVDGAVRMQVLAEIKADEDLKRIPVIVLTVSRSRWAAVLDKSGRDMVC